LKLPALKLVRIRGFGLYRFRKIRPQIRPARRRMSRHLIKLPSRKSRLPNVVENMIRHGKTTKSVEPVIGRAANNYRSHKIHLRNRPKHALDQSTRHTVNDVVMPIRRMINNIPRTPSPTLQSLQFLDKSFVIKQRNPPRIQKWKEFCVNLRLVPIRLAIENPMLLNPWIPDFDAMTADAACECDVTDA